MLLLFYFTKKRSVFLPTSKIKSVPSRPICIKSKAYGELFCPRINYYSQQVVHGNSFAQIFSPVPLMPTLPII